MIGNFSDFINKFKGNWQRDVRAMSGDPVAMKDMYGSLGVNTAPGVSVNDMSRQYARILAEKTPLYGATVSPVGGASVGFMEAMAKQEQLLRKKSMLERLLREETSPAYKKTIQGSLEAVNSYLKNILKDVWK